MKKTIFKKQTILSLLLLVIGIASIFWQFFLSKLYLFPGNYLLAWFEPYKTENFSGSFIFLAHKPIAEDTFKLIYPFKILAVDLIKHFQPPLWNPYNGSGMPLLAAINPGYLDPFNILHVTFNNYFAWTLIIVIETILIAVFTFLYSKSINLGNKASIFTAVVFTLSGAVVTRLVYSQFTLGIAVLPLSLYLLEKYREKFQKKYLFALTLAIGILLLSTHFQYSFYILFFVCFYWILRAKGKRLIPFLFIILGVGFASVQLVPAIELFQYANLNSQSSSFIFSTALLPVKNLITFLIPNYYGNPSTYNYWGVGDYIETAIYIGIIPSFFAFLAIFRIKEIKNSFILTFYFLILLFTLLISLDIPFIRWLYALNIPFLSVGVPTRIFFVTTFSLAILSGFGYKYLIESPGTRKQLLTPIFIFSFFIGLLFIITILNLHSSCPELMKNCRITSIRNSLIELGGFLATLCLIVIYLFLNLSKKRNGYGTAFFIILIVYLLGFYNSYKFLPFSPKETFFPANNVINAIKQVTGNTRVLGIGEANIMPDFATYFHFYDPQYVNPLYIKRYGELVGFANSGIFPPPLLRSDVDIKTDATLSAALEFQRDRLMSILNINYLLYKKDKIPVDRKNDIVWENDKWYIVQRSKRLPRAYLVNKLEVLGKDEKELKTLFSPSFDPATTAVVEKNFLGLSQINGIESKGSATIKKYNENNVLIKTISLYNSFLVLSDNYYPGWKAFVDNKEVPVYRTNYTLRGVAVPSGTHLVYFVYDPLSFKVGVLLSSLSGLIFLAFILGTFIKKRF